MLIADTADAAARRRAIDRHREGASHGVDRNVACALAVSIDRTARPIGLMIDHIFLGLLRRRPSLASIQSELLQAASQHEPSGLAVLSEMTAQTSDGAARRRRPWASAERARRPASPAARASCRRRQPPCAARSRASLRAKCRSSNSCHAIGASNASAIRSVCRLSSWRCSYAQPVFSALKNSSISHRARYQSTTRRTCSRVSIGSVVISRQSTGCVAGRRGRPPTRRRRARARVRGQRGHTGAPRGRCSDERARRKLQRRDAARRAAGVCCRACARAVAHRRAATA